MKKKNKTTLGEEIVNSKLCRLACVRLIQTGEAKKVEPKYLAMTGKELKSMTSYIQDPVRVLETMRDIVNTAKYHHEEETLLKKYCEGKKDLKKVKELWERMGLSTEELG